MTGNVLLAVAGGRALPRADRDARRHHLRAYAVDLARRTRQPDTTGGAALLPYAAWTAFATALTAEIARRNPRAR